MSAAYTPRAGSKAELAIAALATREWISMGEMAEVIDCERHTVNANLVIAEKHGALRKQERDGVAGWALGVPAPAVKPARRVEKTDKRATPAAQQQPAPPRRTMLTPMPANGATASFALYSNGQFAIEQAGDVTCVLLPDETQALIAYLVTQKTLVQQLFEAAP